MLSRIKDESIPLRGTTLLHPNLAAGAFGRTGIKLRYVCAVTGAPVAACAFRQSVRGSETMFGAALRTPSHLPGLSVTYLRVYSSLHCLCQRYSVVFGLCLVYPSRPSLSMYYFAQKERQAETFLCPPVQIYEIPALSWFFRLALAALRRALAGMRLSRRTVVWVPTDWKAWTRMTSTTTETYMIIYIRRW